MSAILVSPEFIAAQREAGWPDVHPEDYCHRCGTRNPLWFTDRETWETATQEWAAQTGREGICCPWCLAELHEHATGAATSWAFVPGAVLAERDRLAGEVETLRARLAAVEAWADVQARPFADGIPDREGEAVAASLRAALEVEP